VARLSDEQICIRKAKEDLAQEGTARM